MIPYESLVDNIASKENMALEFFNTLSRRKEKSVPLVPSEVRMYTCGPTVYNFAHIGNFRTYIFEDILRRYLKFRGFRVTQVMNITDVDDKTIRNSRAAGLSLGDFTRRYTDGFFKDIDTLNIEHAEHYPRATEHVGEMVKIIEGLLEKGYAYKSSDGSVYYDISKFSDYGKLARDHLVQRTAGELAVIGHRSDVKQNVVLGHIGGSVRDQPVDHCAHL